MHKLIVELLRGAEIQRLKWNLQVGEVAGERPAKTLWTSKVWSVRNLNFGERPRTSSENGKMSRQIRTEKAFGEGRHDNEKRSG